MINIHLNIIFIVFSTFLLFSQGPRLGLPFPGLGILVLVFLSTVYISLHVIFSSECLST